ncbi:hypothetical protein PR001_g29564 [Phytophthora rubi]|uniref:Uncharacterized protein n=1 Tax=Phytophthora rubi TaxID=129364 RepID=A0A6A3H1G2_9STRA|nr:hypothetical protein PR001_g29564 [Phytophthora rubi]
MRPWQCPTWWRRSSRRCRKIVLCLTQATSSRARRLPCTSRWCPSSYQATVAKPAARMRMGCWRT